MKCSAKEAPGRGLFFPDWAGALRADESLTPGLRECYRRVLAGFLEFCRQRRADSSVALARDYVELARLEQAPAPARHRRTSRPDDPLRSRRHHPLPHRWGLESRARLTMKLCPARLSPHRCLAGLHSPSCQKKSSRSSGSEDAKRNQTNSALNPFCLLTPRA